MNPQPVPPEQSESSDSASSESDESASEARPPEVVAGAPFSSQGTVGRPPEMYLGAVFLTLAALPLVLAGVALVLQLGAIGTNLRRLVAEKWPGVDVDSVILLVRVAGGLVLLGGLLFVALSWFALRPRRWARAGATGLAVVEILLLVAAMIVTAIDPVSLGLILLAGAGAVLLYLPRSEEFLLAQR